MGTVVQGVLVAALAVLVPSAVLAAEGLTGGRLAKFLDRDGTERDLAVVKFLREDAIVAPLPDPTAATATLRMRSDTADTGAVVLDPSRWKASRSSWVYKVPAKENPPGGIVSIIIKPGKKGGKLVVKAKKDGYGANRIFGPVTWVQVEFRVGLTTYAGRFQSPPAVAKSNTAEKVLFKGKNASIAATGCETPASESFVRPFDVDAEEYPFGSCAFQTSIGRIHYIDEGPRDAPETILLLHGNPTWSFLYRKIAKAMIADGHRVVAPDHLGMGMSDVPSTSDFDYRPRSHADNLEALVLALDLRNVTVVGQDWGGPIGLGMATRHPERISHLLLMNTWAWSIDPVAPGPFHALTFWYTLAKTVGQLNPRFFCDLALPGQSELNAAEADPTRGPLFDSVLSAYLSPAIDVTTGSFRTSEPCAPMQIFAESIIDDDAFQGEVEGRLGSLRGKPYSLLFGLSDILFGALRCDAERSPSCPGSSSCTCDEELLPAQAGGRCGPRFDVCKEPDGSILEPYADRFVELLGEESLVRREVVRDADHMVQEWAPERVIQALRDLLAEE